MSKSIETLIRTYQSSLDDSYFNQIVQSLNVHRIGWIKKKRAQFPSLDRDALDSEYLLVLYEVVMSYASGDFMHQLNAALHRNAIDLFRKEKRHVGAASIDDLLATSEANLGRLPKVPSAEDEYIERTAIDDYMREVALDPQVGPYQRAAIRTRIEDGLSANQVVNIAKDIFRNRQQMWRAEQRAARKFK